MNRDDLTTYLGYNYIYIYIWDKWDINHGSFHVSLRLTGGSLGFGILIEEIAIRRWEIPVQRH